MKNLSRSFLWFQRSCVGTHTGVNLIVQYAFPRRTVGTRAISQGCSLVPTLLRGNPYRGQLDRPVCISTADRGNEGNLSRLLLAMVLALSVTVVTAAGWTSGMQGGRDAGWRDGHRRSGYPACHGNQGRGDVLTLERGPPVAGWLRTDRQSR